MAGLDPAIHVFCLARKLRYGSSLGKSLVMTLCLSWRCIASYSAPDAAESSASRPRNLAENYSESTPPCHEQVPRPELRLIQPSLQNLHGPNSTEATPTLSTPKTAMAKAAFDEIDRRNSCCVIALDINSFFDSIDHKVLKQNLCEILGEDRLPLDWFKVYKSMTQFSWVELSDLAERLDFDEES